MHPAVKVAALACLLAAIAPAQTTQALISGRLVDSLTGRPIAHAYVIYEALNANTSGAAESDEAGYYYLPLLSPSLYRVRFTAPGYQAQELQEIELPVAARFELDLRMRPLSDVWEAGQFRSVFLPGAKTIVTFYGPDVDTSRSGSFEAQQGRRAPLESTVSQVIDSNELLDLPLQGRDVYDMLVTQQGVTADQATGRGLGLSINGQRPTSSNFLLDGLENNNYLITGPLVGLAPELIQEYRISINNFSAEYGRTAGFVANAITYSGTGAFHGMAYFYLRNDVLNANDFQRNRLGRQRVPLKETQPGFRVGGPLFGKRLDNRLVFSFAFENLRARSRPDAILYTFPTTAYIQNLPASSLARQLLTTYAPPPVSSTTRNFATFSIRPTSTIDRPTTLTRFDFKTTRDQYNFRASAVLLSKPDFAFSPYKDFISALHQNTLAFAAGNLHTFSPGLANEARAGYSTDDLGFDRRNPQIPSLVSSDGVSLPGAPFFFPYRNRNGTWQFLDNVIRSRGRHLITAGAGLLLRNSRGILAPGRDGQYFFTNLDTFALDRPTIFQAPVKRETLPATLIPSFRREYRYTQYFFFFQDTFKLAPRLTLNYGLRYENYGSPSNVGEVKDAQIQLGTGTGFPQLLSTGRLVFPGPGDQKLFQTDTKNFAPRVGFSFDPFGRGRTILRGASGIFYDRPFDNLWQTVRANNFTFSQFRLTAASFNYLAPVASVLPGVASAFAPTAPPNPTMIQQDLKNARISSSFLGVQHQLTRNIALEVNGLITLGRRLITTDVINRFGGLVTQPITRVVPTNMNYRGNQGSSNYDALTTVLRYRTSSLEFRASYTLSHSIDNQSDPQRQDLLDFGFTGGTSAGTIPAAGAGFSQQFNSSVDRGNSDFDQRHNVVYSSVWHVPAVVRRSRLAPAFRDWTIAGLGAFRSGFPYTVFGIFGRATLTNPVLAFPSPPPPIAGGVQMLNRTGFATAFTQSVGNTGRNAFTGPGFYNLDVSLARNFALRWIGEGGRVTLRADAFNFLNHTNLGNPGPQLALGTFGQSQFGRSGLQSGFPSLAPLNESSRNIQLLIRIEF